ncbi:MAG: YerC/YecD family TrpR-related protein [Patescibacteria group bacterium]
MTRINNKKTENLYKVILALKNINEAKKFFRDLLTEREIIEFSNRWQAAQMLDNKDSYQKIQRVTGLSTRTIARISKWLNRGEGGYKLMLSKLSHHNSSKIFKKG